MKKNDHKGRGMLGVVVAGGGVAQEGGSAFAAAVIYAAIMSGVTGSQGSVKPRGRVFHKFLMKHNKSRYEERRA